MQPLANEHSCTNSLLASPSNYITPMRLLVSMRMKLVELFKSSLAKRQLMCAFYFMRNREEGLYSVSVLLAE